MSLYEECTSKLTSTDDLADYKIKNHNASEKDHFDIDFTCCTSSCYSCDDYDW